MLNFITTDKQFAVSISLVLIIGILAFIPMQGMPVRIGKMMLAEWCIIITFALFFLKNIWLRVYLIYCVIGVAVHGFQTRIFDEHSFLALNTVFFYLIWYQLVMDNLTNKRVRYLMNGICILAILQTILMLSHLFNIWYFFRPRGFYMGQKMPIVGFMDNPNLSGALIAMICCMFYRKRKVRWWKPSWYWLLPILLFVLFKTKSLAAVVSLSVATAVYLFYKLKSNTQKICSFLIGVMLVSGYWYKFERESHDIKNMKNDIRVSTWINIMTKLAPKRLFYGWGLGQHKIVMKALKKEINPKGASLQIQAHNEPIQLFSEQGAIGLIIGVGYIISLFRKFKKENKLMLLVFVGILCALINSLAIFNFHVTIGLLIMTYFAMYEYLAKEEDNGKVSV